VIDARFLSVGLLARLEGEGGSTVKMGIGEVRSISVFESTG
jgi:hypothetical protein